MLNIIGRGKGAKLRIIPASGNKLARSPITADTLPVLAVLTDEQTPADGFTSGEYSSTAGTISSETAVYFVDDVEQPGTYDLTAGEVVRVREDVGDSAGNTRSFWTAARTVNGGAFSSAFSSAFNVAA